MANKVFYRPGTLEIMGMSDGEDSILLPGGEPYPYIETNEPHDIMHNLVIEKDKKGAPKLFYKEGTLKSEAKAPNEKKK